MVYKMFGLFAIGKIAISLLFQVDAVPDTLISVLVQLPIVAIILWLWQMERKAQREDREIQREDREKDRVWFERMLEIQKEGIRESYKSSGEAMQLLVNNAVKHQDTLLEEIKILSQQVTLNTATVNEIAKVDSVIETLIDRLDRK